MHSVHRQSFRNGLLLSAVGILLVGWLLLTPPGLLGKADAIGYAVCHRLELRSYHLGERQIPLCARCTGMYLGAIAGLSYLFATKGKRSGGLPLRVILLFIIIIILFGVDSINSFITLIPGLSPWYPPHNYLRLITGTAMGMVIAGLLFPAFNQTIWKQFDEKISLDSVKSLLPLMSIALIVDLSVLSENPLFLFFLSIASSLGVVTLLTMVYTMLTVMVFKKENNYNQFKELFLPVMGGLLISMIQISMIDLFRFLLTGTWDGFNIG